MQASIIGLHPMLGEKRKMYLSTGLIVGNYIYLIECLSRCLISIHIYSGETKIEGYLPWKYIGNSIGMLPLNQNIFIFSPAVDHFLIYDCLKQKIITMKLQGMEADEAGFCYSNILIEQGDFIILPFKGKEIKRYGVNGELKFKDGQWWIAVAREWGLNEKLFGNIRMNSACTAGNQLFFSLVNGNQNYLCQYELNQDRHLCKIVYHSEDIAVRGVYAYPNIVLFRRLFSDKTEIVQIALDSGEQKSILINYPSAFEEDVYGELYYLKASFKNKILKIKGTDLKVYRKIYNFEKGDIYIAKGILFNRLRNEILIPGVDKIGRYSIEKTVEEIRKSSSYKEGCGKVFCGKRIWENKYGLNDLVGYLTILPYAEAERKDKKRGKSIGQQIWQEIQ